MDKLQLTGRNLCQVFNFKFGHLHAAHFWCYRVKLPNSKLKTCPKQLLVSLPLVIALPGPTLLYEAYKEFPNIKINLPEVANSFSKKFFQNEIIRQSNL
jgi:hypothetical protein